MFSSFFGAIFSNSIPTLSDQEVFEYIYSSEMDKQSALMQFLVVNPDKINAIIPDKRNLRQTVLHHLVLASNASVLTELMKTFPNLKLDIKDANGNTLLHLAVKTALELKDKKDAKYTLAVNIIKMLVEKDVKESRVDAINSAEESPEDIFYKKYYSEGTNKNEIDDIKQIFVLAKTKNLFKENSFKEISPRQEYYNEADLQRAPDRLLSSSPIFSRSSTPAAPAIKYADDSTEAQLFDALLKGDHAAARIMINEKKDHFDINAKNKNGDTFAHIALQHIGSNTNALLKALMSAGFRFDNTNQDGMTPVVYALVNSKSNSDFNKCLLTIISETQKYRITGMNNPVQTGTFKGCTPIIVAIINNTSPDIFKQLLSLPGVKDSLAYSVLNSASYEDMRGKNALAVAIFLQKKEIVALLNPDNSKVIFPEAKLSRNEFENIATLVAAKATSSMPTQAKKLSSGLSAGEIKNKLMMIFDLKQYAADINSPNLNSGNTLLHNIVDVIKDQNNELDKVIANPALAKSRGNSYSVLNPLDQKKLDLTASLSNCWSFTKIICDNDKNRQLFLNIPNQCDLTPLEYAITLTANDVAIALLESAISQHRDIGIEHNNYCALNIAIDNERIKSGVTDVQTGLMLVYCALIVSIKTDNYDKTKELLSSSFILEDAERFKSSQQLPNLLNLVDRQLTESYIPQNDSKTCHYHSFNLPNDNQTSCKNLFACYLDLVIILKSNYDASQKSLTTQTSSTKSEDLISFDESNTTTIDKQTLQTIVNQYDENTVNDALICLNKFSENYIKYNELKEFKKDCNKAMQFKKIIADMSDATKKILASNSTKKFQ